MTTTPGTIIGGGTAGNNYAQANPNSLQEYYENLISGAVGLITDLNGQKTIVLQAGIIQEAACYQSDAGSETTAQASSAFAALTQIADYCNANKIEVQVEADLTDTCGVYGPGVDAIVYNWATAAAQAGLPITSIENVQEVATTTTSAAVLAQDAANEVLAIQTLINSYAGSSYSLTAGDLKVGDMEGTPYLNGISAGDTDSFAQFWDYYDVDAAAAGLQKFSSVTADSEIQAPWIVSSYNWLIYLVGLDRTAQSFGMTVTYDMQGSGTDASGQEAVRMIEEEGAYLATQEGRSLFYVDNLEFETWCLQPQTVDEVTSPDSMTNAAAEVTATYPLYEDGLITAQGITSVSAPGQEVVTVGSVAKFTALTVQWDSTDLEVGNRLAAVLIDQTGTLAATEYGCGTVSGTGTNVLALSGTAADLAAELASVSLLEANAGPDTLDIELFGAQGQVSDNQIAVLALPAGQATGQTSIDASNAAQGWATSSEFVNAGSVMASETLNWSTTGTLAGTISAQPDETAFVKLDSIYQPLAEYGIQYVGTLDGMGINTPIDLMGTSSAGAGQTIGLPSSAANNPCQDVTPGSAWVTDFFNPAGIATMMTVASTVELFNPATGQLESATDYFVPSPQTIVTQQGTSVPNLFAQQFANGGSQVTEYNTGNNPAWQAGWGSQFSSVTLTRDAAGQLMEEFFQGGPADPSFSMNLVFDPETEALWEEFQGAPSPPASIYYNGVQGFVSGPMYVTEFNTGDNPNWDYLDWGTGAIANTEVQTLYFLLADYNNFFESGDLDGYSYEFVNGPYLDLLSLPGCINVNLNSLHCVTIDGVDQSTGLCGLTAVDAYGATGTVTLTGLSAGGSTLVGGNRVSSLTGFGHDTFVTGAGTTTINTGSGGSTVTMSGASGTVTISGNNNMVNIGTAGNTAILMGTGNTVVAVGAVSITEDGVKSILTVDANGIDVTAAQRDTIYVNGTSDVLDFPNGGTVVACGVSISATVEGNGATVNAVTGNDITLGGNGDTVAATGVGMTMAFTGNTGNVKLASPESSAVVTGDHLTVTLNPNGGTIAATGAFDIINAGCHASINVSGTADIVTAGSGSTINVAGRGERVTAPGALIVAASGCTSLSVSGDSSSVYAGVGVSASVLGNDDQVVAGADADITLSGDGETVTAAGLTATIICISNGDVVTAGDDANIAQFGNLGTLMAGTAASIRQIGSNCQALVLSNGSILQRGDADIAQGGTKTDAIQAGDGDQVTEGDSSTLWQYGIGNSASIGNNGSVSVDGLDGRTDVLNNGFASIQGHSNVVTMGTDASAYIGGSDNILTVGVGSTVIVGGTNETVSCPDGSVTLRGYTSATISGAVSIIVNGINNSAALTVQGTEQIGGGGVLSASFSGTGTVDLVSGTLICAQQWAGPVFQLDGTATLDFVDLSFAGGIQFVHSGGILEFQGEGLSGQQIDGFAAGDKLDMAGIHDFVDTALRVVSGDGWDALTLTDGAHCGCFVLAGAYNPCDFHLSADGHGGTFISYTD